MAIIEALMGKSLYFTSQRLLLGIDNKTIFKHWKCGDVNDIHIHRRRILRNLITSMESIRRCRVLNFRPLKAGWFIYQYEIKVNIPIPARRPLCLAFAQQKYAITPPLLHNTVSYASNYQPRISYNSVSRKGNPKNHATHSTAKTYNPHTPPPVFCVLELISVVWDIQVWSVEWDFKIITAKPY